MANFKRRSQNSVIKNGCQSLLGKGASKYLSLLILKMLSAPPKNDYVNEVIVNPMKAFLKIKGFIAYLDIDDTVAPIAQHARRIPIAYQVKVSERLDELLEVDMIEKVESSKSSYEKAAPVVDVMRDNGEPRICVDMRRVNAET